MIPMAAVPTNLANVIDASNTRSRLDAVAKKLIKHRIILAEILKECVEEFKGLDVRYPNMHILLCFVTGLNLLLLSL